jgi:hypothetical protein
MRDSIDEVGPYFVVIPLRMTHAPGFVHTYLHMTLNDTSVRMMRGTKKQIAKGKGKLVGEVIGCLGGGMEIKVGDYTFTMNAAALWRAVHAQIADGGKVKDLVAGQKAPWDRLVDMAKEARKRDGAQDDNVSDDIVYLAQQMSDIILKADKQLREELRKGKTKK